LNYTCIYQLSIITKEISSRGNFRDIERFWKIFTFFRKAWKSFVFVAWHHRECNL